MRESCQGLLRMRSEYIDPLTERKLGRNLLHEGGKGKRRGGKMEKREEGRKGSTGKN